MEYVIQLLEGKKTELENDMRQRDLMRSNMKQATQHMKHIHELKRAVKVLKAKVSVHI